MTNQEIKEYIDKLRFKHLLKSRLTFETYIRNWGDYEGVSLTMRFRYTNRPPHRETILTITLPHRMFDNCSEEQAKKRLSGVIDTSLRNLMMEACAQCGVPK